MILETPETRIADLKKRIKNIENGLKDNILNEDIILKMNKRKEQFEKAIIILQKQAGLK